MRPRSYLMDGLHSAEAKPGGAFVAWAILILSLITFDFPVSTQGRTGINQEKSPATPTQTQPQAGNIIILVPGKPMERQMSGGETHSYQINLRAGQYVHAVIDQRGIDLVLTLF